MDEGKNLVNGYDSAEHSAYSSEENCSEGSSQIRLFRSILQTAVDSYVTGLKLSWFGRAYPDLYQHRREELRSIHKMVCSQLRSCLESEIDEILKEHELESKIMQLDSIRHLNDHRKGTAAWRPSTKPSEDLKDHFKIPQTNYLENLQAYAHLLKAENDKLEQNVQSKVAEAQKKESQICSMLEPFKKIDKIILELDLQSLEDYCKTSL